MNPQMLDCIHCHQSITGDCAVVRDGTGGVTGMLHSACKPTYARQQSGRIHPCPVCNQTGKVVDTSRPKYTVRESTRSDMNPDAWAGSPACQDYIKVPDGYESKVCGICNGHGYTMKKVEAITQTVTTVIGYRDV